MRNITCECKSKLKYKLKKCASATEINYQVKHKVIIKTNNKFTLLKETKNDNENLIRRGKDQNTILGNKKVTG